MKQRIYIDTSIVGGFFDEEFEAATKGLFKRLEEGERVFVISDLLDLELIEAPERVREILYNYSSNMFERVLLTEEAIKLADAYISAKVVGKTSLEDCRHIALATINRVDILSSWNFKHIVHSQKIPRYNAVNQIQGYRPLAIYSPLEGIH